MARHFNCHVCKTFALWLKSPSEVLLQINFMFPSKNFTISYSLIKPCEDRVKPSNKLRCFSVYIYAAKSL